MRRSLREHPGMIGSVLVLAIFPAALAQGQASVPSKGPAGAPVENGATADDAARKESNPEAEKLIAEMVKAYASCRSYADEGSVHRTFVRSGAVSIRVFPFTTAFVRSDSRFRFEFKSRETEDRDWSRSMIIWGNGEDVRDWLQGEPVEREDSLKPALERAAGRTYRASVMVPPLLLAEQFDGNMLTALENLELAGRQPLGDADCHMVQGRHPGGSAFTLWIDEKTKILRKITEEKKFDEFFASITIDYEPHLDIKLPAEDLEFESPQGK